MIAAKGAADTAERTRKRNIFVVGLDDFNHTELQHLQNADQYVFESLLSYQELRQGNGGSFNTLLAKAEQKLDSFQGSVDAIIAFWDFPAESLAPLLCKKYGLPAASIESVEKCEHKYWSRLEQSRSIPDITPEFCLVDPFVANVRDTIRLPYPFWLKPIKSFSSYLGFKVTNDSELQESLAVIRENITGLAAPFDELLGHVRLPPELAEIHGRHCLAEELVRGELCTLEGYVYEGETTVYGVIDSIREPDSSSFSRYQYPSQLPDQVQIRMKEAARKLMQAIDYNNAPFNIEFFYEEETDQINILEVNPRISQSHCELFRKVDGDSHQEILIDLALGQKPAFPCRKGDFSVAAKCFLRRKNDAFVERVPQEEDISRLKEHFPAVEVHVVAEEGKRLSDMPAQDSYSFELADIYIGASDSTELQKIFDSCRNMLPFKLQDVYTDQ